MIMGVYTSLALLLLTFISSSVSSLLHQSKPVIESPALRKHAPDGWKEFSSSEGGFTILFPRTPRKSTGAVDVGTLVVKTYTYSAQDDAALYSVTYFDVPHAVDDSKVSGELLLGIRNFVLAELKGTLLNDIPVSLENNAGRSLEISVPGGGTARAMIIIAEHRLYRVTVVPAKRVAPEAEASARAVSTRYLESFNLIPIDRSAEGEVDRYLRENPALAQKAFDSDSDTTLGNTLNGKALKLPLPKYPSSAMNARITGTVIVKVVIDEEGKVMVAQAITGHPSLWPNAVKAARQARFSPTLEEGKAVKVYGKITYNFLMR
jgi:TonB family protein